MIGVQIIGQEAVLHRFEKMGYDTWALLQGKQFIVGGTGEEDLKDWLNDFTRSGSTATYTLRVYDSDTAPTAATAGSDYVAAIPFKLVDMYEGYGIAGHTNKLMQRIEGLEKRLNEEGQEDGEGDLNSIIMGWLSSPEKLAVVAGAIRTLFGGAATPAMAGTSIPINGQVIGSTVIPDEKLNQVTDADLVRLSKALDVLGKHDKKLIVHLEKLAKLAETDPLLFEAVIGKLNAL
jgi:hypothetical protein